MMMRAARTLLAADRVIVGDTVEDLLLSVVPDRARVEEDGIGQLGVFRQVEAVHLHDRSDDFAIGDIHLTAVGLDVDTTGGGGG